MNTLEIEVFPRYLPEQSEPKRNRFVYAYTINISNQAEQPVQLISRHWLVTDANDKVQEVQGMGVVGEQPIIEPGEQYQYTSGAVLETETGTMQGSYRMLNDDGSEFDAEIPMFALVPPHALH